MFPAPAKATGAGKPAPQTMKGLLVQGCAFGMPSRMQLVPPSLAFTYTAHAQYRQAKEQRARGRAVWV